MTVPKFSMPKCFVPNGDGSLPITGGGSHMDAMLQQAVRAGVQAKHRDSGGPLLVRALNVRKRSRSDAKISGGGDDAMPSAADAADAFLASLLQPSPANPQPPAKRVKMIPLVAHSEESLQKMLTVGHHRCMWDLGEFEGLPVTTPTRHLPRTDQYRVRGIYCSPACAKAAILSSSDGMREMRLNWFCDMMRRHYGIGYRKRIVPAPPREALDILGGPYTLEEFRGKSEMGICSMVVNGAFVLEEVQIGELDSKSARAHVEWIKNSRAAAVAALKQPSPAVAVAVAGTNISVKQEPVDSATLAPATAAATPTGILPRNGAMSAADWFMKLAPPQ
jgi:hypothetical protein